MPKVKTVSGAKKRFRFTGKGKPRRNKAYKSHILTKKTTKQKRRLRKSFLFEASDAREIRRLLPYGR